MTTAQDVTRRISSKYLVFIGLSLGKDDFDHNTMIGGTVGLCLEEEDEF